MSLGFGFFFFFNTSIETGILLLVAFISILRKISEELEAFMILNTCCCPQLRNAPQREIWHRTLTLGIGQEVFFTLVLHFIILEAPTKKDYRDGSSHWSIR
jgi:hypothetical protein